MRYQGTGNSLRLCLLQHPVVKGDMIGICVEQVTRVHSGGKKCIRVNSQYIFQHHKQSHHNILSVN